MNKRATIILILTLVSLIPINLAKCPMEKIQYSEGLELLGKTRREYVNKTLIVEGPIKVSENTSLILRDSNLTILWTRRGEANQQVLVEDKGELILENSNIMIRLDQIPNYSTSGRFIVRDMGKLTMMNSSIQCTHDMTLLADGNSSLKLSRAYYTGEAESSNLHWAIEDRLPESLLIGYSHYYRLGGESNSRILIEDSKIGFLGLYGESICSVQGSEIDHLAPYSNRETNVIASTIGILMANQYDSYFNFTGKLAKHYTDWRSKTSLGEAIRANVHLRNSGFNNLWLRLVNCTSEISDAELWLVSTYMGDTRVENSDFTILEHRYGDAFVKSSNIKYFLGECVDGSLIIDGCDIIWAGLTGYNRETDYHVVAAEISDSEIDRLDVNFWYHVDEVDINVTKTQIYNLTMKPAPSHNIIFDESWITGFLKLYPQQYEGDVFNVSGKVNLSLANLISHPNIFFTRVYTVQVSHGESVFPGATVEIYRKGTLWKTDTTDTSGSFVLEVQWVNNTKPETPYYPLENPLDNMTTPIVIKLAGSDISRQVSPLTSSPIALYLKPRTLIHPVIAHAVIVVLFLYSIYIIREFFL